MTRLADALERAGGLARQNRSEQPVSPPPGPSDAARGVLVAAPPPPSTADAAPPPQLTPAPTAGRRLLVNLPPDEPLRRGRGSKNAASNLRLNPGLSGRLVATAGISHVSVEQYRKLAATLHHAQTERGIKTVMVSSAVAGEGKTLTVSNLALTLSESYRRRVILIDADLRRPSLHQVFDLPNVSGLNDGLKADTERPLPLIQISSTLTVLTAGRPDPDPMSALTSPRMRRILEEAASLFEWVLIDTPPVGLLPDARLLASMADAALLVIRAGRSPFELVKRAAEGLGQDRIIGVVLNGAEYYQERSTGYYGYGGYYGYEGHSGDQGG